MKSNTLTMIRTYMIAGFTCAALFTACKKDSTSTSSAAVSEEEAAEAITEAVTPESGGMVTQVDQSVAITAGFTSACGASFDSSISNTATVASVTYSYQLDWNWMLKCATGIFEFNFNGATQYNAPRMSSDDKSSGTFTVAGFQTSKAAYTVNSTYTRNGSQQSKILKKNSFTSTISIISSDIEVDKSSMEITSGTASVTISGASTSGASFVYKGTITFNGNKTATLVLSNGSTYEISWA